MPSYLLNEDGTHVLLEDGSKIVLEDAEAAPELPTAWFDGVTISIRVALSADTGLAGVWDQGLFNAATWGPDIVWNEVSRFCRGFTTTRAFQRDLAAWQTGTATVTLGNLDGRFSPSNLTGPYVTNGVTGVRPWRPIDIRATYGAITYTLFTGYVTSWIEGFDVAHPDEAVVTLPCVDELGHLAGFNGYEQTAQGGGEFFGQRIHRVLNNAGHTGPRAVDLGRNTMQPTTLAANAVTDLKLTADSEGGALWIDTDGAVMAQDRYALMERTASTTIQATFGDDPTNAAEFKYSEVTPDYSGDQVANFISLARAGGTARVSGDSASRALYGDLSPSTANRNDLICETDAMVDVIAQIHLATHKDPEELFASLTIKPRRDAATLFPQSLGRKVRDLIRVIKRGDHTRTKDCFVAGITHTVTRTDWTTVFPLWSATVYQSFVTPRWDEGTWDTSTWFF